MNLIREFKVGDIVKLSAEGIVRGLGNENMRGEVVDIQKYVTHYNHQGPGTVFVEKNPHFVIVYWVNLTGSSYGYRPKDLKICWKEEP